MWLWLGIAVTSLRADTNPPPHWAFQPVREPSVPAVANPAWCRTPIDRFVLARLEAAGLRPAPAADRRSWIRRATLDLTGLPATADAADAFVADPSPDAHGRVVEGLLASPRYGEQWGRHWLDVVRYADTAGETADYPVPVAWRYRNHVIDAFNADKPYDEFLRDQVAGDILARRGPRDRYAERVTATGFLAISRRFGFDSENYHHLTIQDTIDTLGQSVMGLTLGCARCHAHKFDPVSTEDYYGLYGIFESTRYAFPGSEQKQRSRALVPLLPPEESLPKWREFESRVAVLAKTIERNGGGVPGGILRSLDDIDGDFEMQAPAAGGSKGVLVPPWTCDGPISVTTDAQSPFKNLYPGGRVGTSVAAGTNTYYIAQAIHPRRARGEGRVVRANLDFRVATNDAAARGSHRFRLGAGGAASVVEIWLSADAAAVHAGDRVETIRRLRPNEWHNLQLAVDLDAGTVTGTVGVPGDVAWFGPVRLAPDATAIDRFAVESAGSGDVAWPGIAFDNIAVQDAPIPAVTTTPPAIAALVSDADPAGAKAELQRLAGIDGDFELQADGAAPATPWGPGPNSTVRISAGSQSPFRNLYPKGRLGIRLPNAGVYNGFGQTLTNRWQADRTGRLYAGFDFRCADAAAGGDGSWRYYLGHGPGGSGAIEVAFNGSQFFRRSGDARAVVRPIKVGEWYQVQVALDLKARTYTGSISTPTERTEFAGDCTTGWDGSIDYTFVDSYGHLEGVKPALDADNFAIGETPLAPLNGPEIATGEGVETRRARIAAIRERLARGTAEAERARVELERLLVEGPFELAYGVSEGTPRDARIQQRGEPDRPGDSVPRGMIAAVGGKPLAADAAGSGRLELAEWLASPRNPLTARVMVNRIWQYHFGRGLVATPNDFGRRGQAPSDPELLDWLATRFVRDGWSVKAMHRLIMGSSVYRQRSLYSPGTAMPADVAKEEAECPVGGVGLVRGPSRDGSDLAAGTAAPRAAPRQTAAPAFARRRLSAEEARDAILFASGALDSSPGHGHPFPSPTGWGFTQHAPFGAVYDHDRRSVYLMTQRIRRHPFLALFDGADPNASTAERRVTTVPTQALYFLNDPFVHANADRFAARVLAGGGDAGRRVEASYRFALGRGPSEVERAEALGFLSAYRGALGGPAKDGSERGAFAAFARVLFGSNEFLTVD